MCGRFGTFRFIQVDASQTQNPIRIVSWLFQKKKARLLALLSGLTTGFFLQLKVAGIGFKAVLKSIMNSRFLSLSLGYNHDINIKVPSSIIIVIKKKKLLILKANSFFQLSAFKAYLRLFKISNV